ncbi:hypothetical protein CSKR_108081 [Clonorchis sinensis]|uniref:ZSWIM1/3 RNaseH-like domain-containing protein n=1 Tax=Clonorchis sinensis TaxID=79923 RepID=A0A3R7CW55_CLOSI|nr:hypothetical protein CSKR_108081 [Clonorchis sinensis]
MGRVLTWQSEEGHYSHTCLSRWQQAALFRYFSDVVNVDGMHVTNHFAAKLQETGWVLVLQSEEGHYSHVCFSRWHRIALFRCFSGDGTRTTNRFGCKLYTFLTTNGMATGRPVMYAFAESEQFVPMLKLFDLSKLMMKEEYPVKAFVMDKLATRMLAVFGCNVMLCYFHIRKAIRKHSQIHCANSRHIFHRMACLGNALLTQIPARSAASAPNGPAICPLPCGPLGVRYQKIVRTRIVCNGSVTKNRLENDYGRLKDRLHLSDTLEHALQKVYRHAERLMREFEMHTSHHCDRWQILEGDGYVLNVVPRMTTYARSFVLGRLGAATAKAAL